MDFILGITNQGRNVGIDSCLAFTPTANSPPSQAYSASYPASESSASSLLHCHQFSLHHLSPGQRPLPSDGPLILPCPLASKLHQQPEFLTKVRPASVTPCSGPCDDGPVMMPCSVIRRCCLVMDCFPSAHKSSWPRTPLLGFWFWSGQYCLVDPSLLWASVSPSGQCFSGLVQGSEAPALTHVVLHQLLHRVELNPRGDVVAACVQLANLVMLHMIASGLIPVPDGQGVGTCGEGSLWICCSPLP